MSGVAEGLAGLTLSAISVAALFSTCIECFNVVAAARDFGHDYELLCTALAIQKLRLFLWGESIGLASRNASAHPESYHPGLDDPLISPVILRTLQSIKHLLVETRNLNARYAINEAQSTPHRHSRGLDIFRSSFDELEAAFERNQKQKSVKAVTRWAIHDADKFETIIKRLRGFIDGLQDISKSLGVLSDQQARLKEEIESISDKENLQLICDAAGQEDVADVARQQLQLQEMSCGIREPDPLEHKLNLAMDGNRISSIEASDPQLASTFSASRSQANQCFPAIQDLLEETYLLKEDDDLFPSRNGSVSLRRRPSERRRQSLSAHTSTKQRSTADNKMAQDEAGVHALRSRSAENRVNIDSESRQEELDQSNSPRDRAPQRARNFIFGPPHLQIEGQKTDLLHSNSDNFGQLFPSCETLFLHHDQGVDDSNMTLSVATATSQGFGPRVQLFCLKMNDLKNRSFSLRRYHSASGREVCRTSRVFRKTVRKRTRVRRSISNSVSSIHSISSGFGGSSASQTSSLSGADSATGWSESSVASNTSTKSKRPRRASSSPEPTNHIAMDFSNYAHFEISRTGTGREKSYDFYYWGSKYQWRRTRWKDGSSTKLSYTLRSPPQQQVLAHISIEETSNHQKALDKAKGAWIPQARMRITDQEISSGNCLAHIPDLVIATGVVVFVDDCIKAGLCQIEEIERRARSSPQECDILSIDATSPSISPRPFSCPICEESFSRRRFLQVHMDESCGGFLRVRSNLRRHRAKLQYRKVSLPAG